MESISLLDDEMCKPSLEPLRSSTLASALLFMNSKNGYIAIDESDICHMIAKIKDFF